MLSYNQTVILNFFFFQNYPLPLLSHQNLIMSPCQRHHRMIVQFSPSLASLYFSLFLSFSPFLHITTATTVSTITSAWSAAAHTPLQPATSLSLSLLLFPHHHCYHCQRPTASVASHLHQSPPVRGGSNRGSLAVVAMVMWKWKEKERKREGKGREGQVAGPREM